MFAGFRKRCYLSISYKDSTDALRDNLYLLLNRHKIQQLFMMKLVIKDREAHVFGDDRLFSRER